MEQDFELARKAGMSAHVAKPVDPLKLYRTLAECIKPDLAKPFDFPPVVDGAAGNPSGRAEVPELPGALPGIDMADGLGHLAGKVPPYLRLLRQFPERQGGTVVALRASVLGGDRDGSVRLAHSLKAVAGNLGARALSAASREAEAALKEGREVGPLIDAMEAALQEVVAGIEGWKGSADTGVTEGGAAIDAARVEERLAALEGMLREDDTAALGVIDELAGDPTMARLLAPTRKRAEAYDFEAALANLAELRTLMTKAGNQAKGDS